MATMLCRRRGRSSALLAALLSFSSTATVYGATIHVVINAHQQLTLGATRSPDSPLIPSTLPPVLALIMAGNACTTVRMPANGSPKPFVLFVRAGGCTFDQKMQNALQVGAAALIVAKTLAQQYEIDVMPEAPARALQLANPCAVDCRRGRGLVDASTLKVADILAGLPGHCPTVAYDSPQCGTELCAFSSKGLNASASGGSVREVCCALDTSSLQMVLPNASSARGDVPALYLHLSFGQRLMRECGGRSGGSGGGASGGEERARLSTCQVRLEEADTDVEPSGSGWDGSALLIFAIGVGSAALAAWLAGNDQHEEDREARESSEAAPSAEISQATLDVSSALAFPLMASALLVTLYFLLQAGITSLILLGINLLYVLATASASASLLFLPLVARCLPTLSRRLLRVPSWLGGVLPMGEAVALLLALATSATWFLRRRHAWMWLLQDVLSVCVCVMFVRAMRLPSLRVAAVLLGLMFCYDIFMVFISPMLFKRSIMVAVATAGAPTASVSAAGTCDRTEGDTFPMLFLAPRLAPLSTPYEHIYAPPLPPLPPPPPPLLSLSGDAAEDDDKAGGFWQPTRGGLLWRLSGASREFGMLGLGDVVLPALALCFARRVDLARRDEGAVGSLGGGGARSAAAGGGGGGSGGGDGGGLGYFGWAVGGYALGLGITLAANAYDWTFNDVKGQPALLYLVPGVLGSLLLRSRLHGEMRELFTGSTLVKQPTSPPPTPTNDDGGSSDGNGSGGSDGSMWPLLFQKRGGAATTAPSGHQMMMVPAKEAM